MWKVRYELTKCRATFDAHRGPRWHKVDFYRSELASIMADPDSTGHMVYNANRRQQARRRSYPEEEEAYQ